MGNLIIWRRFVTTVKLEAAGRTHVGMKRSHNEPVFVCARWNLFIVAGGGTASGEIASQLSVETLAEFSGRPGRWRHHLAYKMDKEKLSEKTGWDQAQ